MKTKLAEAYKEYKKKQDEINARLGGMFTNFSQGIFRNVVFPAAEREKIVEETPVLAELVMSEENDTDTVSKPPEKEEAPQPEEGEPPEKKKKEESEAESGDKPAEEVKWSVTWAFVFTI